MAVFAGLLLAIPRTRRTISVQVRPLISTTWPRLLESGRLALRPARLGLALMVLVLIGLIGQLPRLWLKVSPLPHTAPGEVETYGGQPNKQAADMITTFDPGRMIWNGYTGAAGWMFRQAIEGVLGLRLDRGTVTVPVGLDTGYPVPFVEGL